MAHRISQHLVQSLQPLAAVAALQHRRLSTVPPFTITHRESLPVTDEEVGAVRRVTQNLSRLIGAHGARVNVDIDILKEFMH